MSTIASFILNSSSWDDGKYNLVITKFIKTSDELSELIFFTSHKPSKNVLEQLKNSKYCKIVWSTNKNINPLNKALLITSGHWVVFCSLDNIFNDYDKLIHDLRSHLSGLALCQLTTTSSRLTLFIGIRNISNTPLVAFKKHFVTKYPFDEVDSFYLLKLADKKSSLELIHATSNYGQPFFNSKTVLVRPCLRIVLHFFKRAIFWFLRKSRSFPRYLIIKLQERIRIIRTRPVSYSPKIPVFIITRDRIAPLKKLVEWLEQEGLINIIFVDNNSTYLPLLKYFNKTPYEVIRLPNNIGHKAPWSENIIQVYASNQPFIVTDPDVIPDSRAHGAIKEFVYLLNKYRRYIKVGFALHIDDLPDSFELKQSVIVWESQFWKKEIEKDVYNAPTDTTFALYRSGTPHIIEPSLRTGKFQARHEPWYMDSKNPDEEISYYREHSDKVVGTWGLKKGDLSPFYVNYVSSQDR